MSSVFLLLILCSVLGVAFNWCRELCGIVVNRLLHITELSRVVLGQVYRRKAQASAHHVHSLQTMWQTWCHGFLIDVTIISFAGTTLWRYTGPHAPERSSVLPATKTETSWNKCVVIKCVLAAGRFWFDFHHYWAKTYCLERKRLKFGVSTLSTKGYSRLQIY